MEFLSNLSDALANRIYVDAPFLEYIGKLGTVIIHDGVCKEVKQFHCTPALLVGEGPGIDHNAMTFNDGGDFGIEHIQKLVAHIEGWSKKIRFVHLFLPPTLVAQTHRKKNILGRYTEDYYHPYDEVLKRWDFLIQKLD